ncbi:unnamed protein product [Caenorhabditis auriculariae]|uniref:OToPetrin-Like n=1 Tax=Caenorhabditis auriculariae TaxID=2777116 RepID=A0A8S1GVV6_9PELO|nr:unnamed protein product [Caenorhabditis auriculariae]
MLINEPSVMTLHLPHLTPGNSRKSSVAFDDAEKSDSDPTDIPLYTALPRKPWVHEPKATIFFVRLITSMYALVLTIVAIVVEISPTWRAELWLAETVFYCTMYGIGILFFIYCYLFIIYPEAYNYLIRLSSKLRLISNEKNWLIVKTTHAGEGAGTLYLRLGTLFFGIIGIVLFGLEVVLCVENSTCRQSAVAKNVIGIIFTFIQMHFIFCNSKITIDRTRIIAYFGMMHLVAVNLWTWFRFVLAKTEAKQAKKIKSEKIYSSSSSSEEILEAATTQIYRYFQEANKTSEPGTEYLQPVKVTTTTVSSVTAISRLYAMDHFGDLATFLTTCLVEYSIIGAAVMFIIWKSIGHVPEQQQVKRKQKMRIDCSSSSAGFFAGIIFMIGSFVSMGAYSICESIRNNSAAQLMIGIVDLCLFTIALGACLIGLWRMRLLQYRLHAHGEIIDEILLIIGLIGEIVYCSVGMDVFLAGRKFPDGHSLLPAFVFVVRIVQVIVQAAFILITSRLRCLSPYAAKYKPGKEIITFLLVSNASLFGFHSFEAMKSSFGFSSKAAYSYNSIIHAVSPLLVFYRFHSSACLAEIWKHTYSSKVNDHASDGSINFSHTNLTISTPVSDTVSNHDLLPHGDLGYGEA